MISFEEFRASFGGGVISRLKDGLVPLETQNVEALLRDLYKDITSYTYHPSVCHEYVVSNKGKGVVRIVPVFSMKDSLLYYFCTKMIEEEIAKNRVEGTYGGWTMGNPLREEETREESEIMSDYDMVGSFNPYKWFVNWKDFQKKAKLYSLGSYGYIVKVDIANFYDNINLHVLERKLFAVVGHEKRFYVEILLHFLRSWNNGISGFALKHVGIPQDITADCSRLLANFYLQDYDQVIKDSCDQHGARYLRYADDQIFFTKSKENAEMILVDASRELLRYVFSLRR